MTKGGYQILDLKNFVFKGQSGGGGFSSVNIPGIHNKIKGTTKPILVSGFVWGNYDATETIEFRDFFATPIPVDLFIQDGYADLQTKYPNSYVIRLPFGIEREGGATLFIVTKDDNVTIPTTI